MNQKWYLFKCGVMVEVMCGGMLAASREGLGLVPYNKSSYEVSTALRSPPLYL